MAAKYGVKVSGPANVSTIKKYSTNIQPEAIDITGQSMFAKVPGGPGEYKGDIKIHNSDFGPLSQPMNKGAPAEIRGMAGLHNDIGESSGFITDGYLDKQGTHFGEAAKFNFLPPGMDISNQLNTAINEMPLRKIVAESYPGDGWMPAPNDIPE